MRLFFLCLFAFSTSVLNAQTPSDSSSTIQLDRVTEVISFLASDELAGRDTPSPGLERAADYIAEQFRSAGLEPIDEEAGYFQRYTAEGIELDSDAIEVTLHVGSLEPEYVQLTPESDVRLWAAGGAFNSEQAEVTLFKIGEDVPRRERDEDGPKLARIMVVDENDPRWQAAAGVRPVLKRRRAAGPPTLLLLSSALPDEAFTASIIVPEPPAVDIPLRNPVGILRGSVQPDEFVVVTAHYDHVGLGPAVDGDAIYNGADDDASGTTAVVTIAESLAKLQTRPARSIAFVGFSGEEKGMYGSRAFADDPPFPLESMVVNINIEMLGHPPDGITNFAWFTGPDLSDFAEIAGPALARAGVGLVEFSEADDLFTASDNVSLARFGVVAHSVSAGTLHDDYHRPSDETEAMDLEHMTKVINGIREVVLEFAQRDQRPAYNEKGIARIEDLEDR